MNPLGKSRWLRLALWPLAWPFVLLYAFVVRLKNAAFDFQFLKSRRLRWPVVSVGNLSTGGSGKTPMVMLLARLLEEQGFSVDVLSRGYGRNQRGAIRATAGENWRKAGDEPTLMARHGFKVFVAAERYEAGLLAEQGVSADPRHALERVHILDDGFQHRQLARAVDLVLLRRGDLKDDMLPLGRLREPLAALERADICVLRTEDSDLFPHVLSLMRQRDPSRIWLVERQTVLPALGELERSAAFAFCGLGDPNGFFKGLRAAHVDLEGVLAFPDHHVYTPRDIERIGAQARRCGARCIFTTEKDCVRLDDSLRSALEAQFPLIVTGLHLALVDPDRCMDNLKTLISERFRMAPAGVR